MVVDFHAHLMPPNYASVVQTVIRDAQRQDSLPWRLTCERILTNVRMGDRVMSIDRRLEEMDTLGIEMQVLSLAAANVLSVNDDVDAELAKEANDGLAEAVGRYPSRFVGLATLPIGDVDRAIAELDRAVDHLGLRGVILGASHRGAPLDSQRLAPLYERIHRRALPVLVHPTMPPGLEQMQAHNLESSVGYLFETTLAVARMALDGVFEKFPNMRVVVPHLGGAIPFIQARIDNAFNRRPESERNISKAPSEYFKRLYFDCVSSYGPAVAYTIEFAGARHLVFGSDMPHTVGGEPGQLLGILNSLPSESRRAISSENATRILGIDQFNVGAKHSLHSTDDIL